MLAGELDQATADLTASLRLARPAKSATSYSGSNVFRSNND